MGIIKKLKIIILRMKLRKMTRTGFNEVIIDAYNKGTTLYLPGSTSILVRSAIRSYYTSLIVNRQLSLLLRFEGVDFDEIVEEEYIRAQNRYTKMYGVCGDRECHMVICSRKSGYIDNRKRRDMFAVREKEDIPSRNREK